MSYNNNSKINIQQEFLQEELENIQKKIEDKKSIFQKIKFEISFLNKRKKLVEEELSNFTPNASTNIAQPNTPNQSGKELTREKVKELIMGILQEMNNPTGLRISEVSDYIEDNYSESYNDLSQSRVRRAMVELDKEKKIIATNPDNKKFIKYIINTTVNQEEDINEPL